MSPLDQQLLRFSPLLDHVTEMTCHLFKTAKFDFKPFSTVYKIVDFNCKKVTYHWTEIRPLITGQVSKAYGYWQQNSFLPEKHWSIVLKFLSKSIIIRLTSKLSQLSGRGVAQLSVGKPKFTDFFRWRRFTRHNHCVQIFATFPLTQGDLLENQEDRS